MFDPYHKWLAIPKNQRPPTYYQLLGVGDGESDPEVIEEAAIRQMAHLRTYQTGPNAELCTKLLNELAAAKTILMNPAKRKAYDAELAKKRPRRASPDGESLRATANNDEFKFDKVGDVAPRSSRKINIAKPAPGGVPLQWMLAGAGGVLVLVLVVVFVVFSRSSTSQPPVVANKDVAKKPPKKINKGKQRDDDPIVKKQKKQNPKKQQPVDKKPPVKKINPPEPKPPIKKIEPKTKDGVHSFPTKKKERVERLTLSPDGSILVAGQIRLTAYEVQTGRILGTFPIPKGRGFIRSPCIFFTDGKRVLYAYGNSPAATIGDPTTGTPLSSMTQTGVQYVVCLDVSADGKRALVGYNNCVTHWDVETQSELRRAKTKTAARKLVIEPDGRNAVLAQNPTGRGGSSSITYWDLDNLKQIRRVSVPGAGQVRSLAMTPDGRTVAFASKEKLALVELPNLVVKDFAVPDPVNHTAVVFCNHGKTLAAGGKDGIIRLYDVATRRQIASWKGHTAEVMRIAADAHDRIVVTGDRNGTIFVWPLSKVGAAP